MPVLVPDFLYLAVGEHVVPAVAGWGCVDGVPKAVVYGEPAAGAVPPSDAAGHDDGVPVPVAVLVGDRGREAGGLSVEPADQGVGFLLVVGLPHFHRTVEDFLVRILFAHLLLGDAIAFHDVLNRHVLAFGAVVRVGIEDDPLLGLRGGGFLCCHDGSFLLFSSVISWSRGPGFPFRGCWRGRRTSPAWIAPRRSGCCPVPSPLALTVGTGIVP